jgi:hypothetical protein
MKRLAILLLALLTTAAYAETRSVTIAPAFSTGRPVPVSIDLLTLRDQIGAEFPMNWTSLRVLVDGERVPFQIDDVDTNGRISAGDELSFLATGTATIEVDDAAGAPTAFASAFSRSGDDPVVLRSEHTPGFAVEVPAHGLVRIVGFGDTEAMLANEIGILRFSGFPESTYWADGQLGPHEEYTNLEAGGMRHVGTTILEEGPARVTVVAEYASDRFVGLTQRLVTRIYATGDVEISNDVALRGYSDIMKLQSMATGVMSQADPESLHLMPVFRRLVWADQLGVTPEAYFAERAAVTTVDGTPYLAFRADDNLSPLYWGATYIFASAEPWRANYSEALGIGVAELAHETPEIIEDYDAWLSGITWVFESQEFRSGVFKWTAEEFGTYEATAAVTPSEANHFIPGDAMRFHLTYSVFEADSRDDAIRYARDRQAEIASAKLE